MRKRQKKLLSVASRLWAVRKFVTIVKIQHTSLFNDMIESINFYAKLVHKDKVYIQVEEI